MPYPNEHAARVKDPSAFDPESFRNKDLKNGIRIIVAKLKGEDAMTVQAYRFSVKQFTPEEAKQWLKDHKVSYIMFEAASEPEVTHSGVIGMKWGVRNHAKTNLPRGTVVRTKNKMYIAVGKSKPGDSSHHKIYSEIKRKKVKDMSDDELKIVTKRTVLLSLYKKSGTISKKKARQMSNEELQGHVDKYLLRKAIAKNPVRKWNFKDFVKTYKLSDADAKSLLDRVNAENTYYTAKNANTTAVEKYVKTFLDTNP